MKVKPMGMLLMMLADWINRHQQDVIVKNLCVAGSGMIFAPYANSHLDCHVMNRALLWRSRQQRLQLLIQLSPHPGVRCSIFELRTSQCSVGPV